MTEGRFSIADCGFKKTEDRESFLWERLSSRDLEVSTI
jgi:hypothetical protein